MQLAFVLDPLADDLAEPTRVAVEAAIRDQERQRAAAATTAPCRCERPWGEVAEGHCLRCGREREP